MDPKDAKILALTTQNTVLKDKFFYKSEAYYTPMDKVKQPSLLEIEKYVKT